MCVVIPYIMMKLAFLSLALFTCTLSFAFPIQNNKLDPNALAKLTSALGIPEDADLLLETQKHWLRKPDQERWEMNELPPTHKQLVLDWAKEQGLYDTRKPLLLTYGQALILGATTGRMKLRLSFLTDLWNEGVRFNEIVWLTGERPLDPRIEDLLEICQNESEAARAIWANATLPEEMKNLPVTFIIVPMKKQGNKITRPTTADTLDTWFQAASQISTALFVSDQPFCGYQFAVIHSTLPQSIPFEVVGPGMDPFNHPAAAAVTLDTVARWVYQDSLNPAF